MPTSAGDGVEGRAVEPPPREQPESRPLDLGVAGDRRAAEQGRAVRRRSGHQEAG